ncbi:MAG: hypothetical protein WC337_10240 [Candidatus Muiribacteriota bacterium]
MDRLKFSFPAQLPLLNGVIHDLFFWDNSIKIFKNSLLIRCFHEDLSKQKVIKTNILRDVITCPVYKIWIVIKNIEAIKYLNIEELNCINYMSYKNNELFINIGTSKNILLITKNFEIEVRKKHIKYD